MLQIERQVAPVCLQPLNSLLSLVSVPGLTASCLLDKTFRIERTGELSTPSFSRASS